MHCPGAPEPSPRLPGSQTVPCAIGYAWRAYRICGQYYQAVFDFTDLGTWAYEINGSFTNAWYRIHPAYWDTSSVTLYSPDPQSACAGVRFSSASIGELECSCPQWYKEISYVVLTVRWKATLDGASELCMASPCPDIMEPRLGTVESIVLKRSVSEDCVMTGYFPGNQIQAKLRWRRRHPDDGDCFRGPEWIDLCNPCEELGAFDIEFYAAECGYSGTFWFKNYIDEFRLKRMLTTCAEEFSPVVATSTPKTDADCGSLAETITLDCLVSEMADSGAGTGWSVTDSGGDSTTVIFEDLP